LRGGKEKCVFLIEVNAEPEISLKEEIGWRSAGVRSHDLARMAESKFE
jgi:hypothetical protein